MLSNVLRRDLNLSNTLFLPFQNEELKSRKKKFRIYLLPGVFCPWVLFSHSSGASSGQLECWLSILMTENERVHVLPLSFLV